DVLLMGDAKKPASQPFVLTQTVDVSSGADERFLDNIEARLFIVNQLECIGIERQLVASEKSVPGRRIPGPGLGDGQLFAFGHCQHLLPVECGGREKVQLESVLFGWGVTGSSEVRGRG